MLFFYIFENGADTNPDSVLSSRDFFNGACRKFKIVVAYI